MSYQAIKTDQVDRVAIITLNRPEVLTCISQIGLNPNSANGRETRQESLERIDNLASI